MGDLPNLPDLSKLKPGWLLEDELEQRRITEELPPDMQEYIRKLVERATDPGYLCRELANLCRTNRAFAYWCSKKDTDVGSNEQIWRTYFETAFGKLSVSKLTTELSDGSWKQLFKDACYMLTQVPWLRNFRTMTREQLLDLLVERYMRVENENDQPGMGLSWLDMIVTLRLGMLTKEELLGKLGLVGARMWMRIWKALTQ